MGGLICIAYAASRAKEVLTPESPFITNDQFLNVFVLLFIDQINNLKRNEEILAHEGRVTPSLLFDLTV